MKKGIALLLICLFAVVGIYTFIDIIESVFNVARYETFTLAATGTLFGKAVFLLVVIVAFTFSIKFYRKKLNLRFYFFRDGVNRDGCGNNSNYFNSQNQIS